MARNLTGNNDDWWASGRVCGGKVPTADDRHFENREVARTDIEDVAAVVSCSSNAPQKGAHAGVSKREGRGGSRFHHSGKRADAGEEFFLKRNERR
jgi:hypothetical protein